MSLLVVRPIADSFTVLLSNVAGSALDGVVTVSELVVGVLSARGVRLQRHGLEHWHRDLLAQLALQTRVRHLRVFAGSARESCLTRRHVPVSQPRHGHLASRNVAFLARLGVVRRGFQIVLVVFTPTEHFFEDLGLFMARGRLVLGAHHEELARLGHDYFILLALATVEIGERLAVWKVDVWVALTVKILSIWEILSRFCWYSLYLSVAS